MLLALFLALPAPQDDPEKLYGDWMVACDNLRHCEMTSLYPAEREAPEDDAFDASMSLIRDAGPAGSFTIEVSAALKLGGKATLRIDDITLATAVARDESVIFTGADAARIAAAMPGGRTMVLLDGNGKVAARVSLAGSSASLRHIDANQARAGTVTAVVARGTKPASAVPAARAPERILAIRPSGTPAAISKAMRAGMEKQSDCDGLYDGAETVPEVETHALGGGKTLALLPCGAGAYNYSSVAFIVAGGKAVRAVFDASDGMLVNAGFGNGLLTSYAKARGVGDCGNAETYVWDGARFRMTEASSMDACRGSNNWLTTFRATPVFR